MTGIFQDLEMVFQGMCSWISFLPRITFSNVTEIIILTILVYYALLWIKSTKAWYLLRGIAMIMAFAVAAANLSLGHDPLDPWKNRWYRG